MATTEPASACEVHRLALDSGPAAPGEASLWVRTLLSGLEVKADWIEGLDLCAVEAVANIVDHAYADSHGEIALRLDVADSFVSLTFEDNAPAFDPMSREQKTLPRSLDDATIGGYGIHLIRNIADDLRYERLADTNRLTVTFGSPPRRARHTDRRHSSAQQFPIVRDGGVGIASDQRSGIDRRSLGFISRTDLFRNVAWDELEQIVAKCRIIECRTGDVVLAAGQRSSRVWVVIEGGLQVHFDNPGSEDFVEISCGECVGEVSAADGKLSSAWVIAAVDSRLLEIDANVFLERLLSIPRVGRNLINVLADRMRLSNQRIAKRVQLEVELKALQRELDFARRIQASMLPANPLFPGEGRLDCQGFMRAARQVGGDFYDGIQLDSDRYLLAIGDVCNKGMPAALFMAQSLALLRSLALRGRDDGSAFMSDLAGEGNDELCRTNTEQLFVSLFVAVVDLRADEMRYVNAGHNAPLILLPGTQPRFLDKPRNPVAGMVPGLSFQAGQVAFPPGSSLLLYTDGVTEAEAADGTQLGEEALVALMASSAPSAADLVERIVSRVDVFAEGQAQADDITLLAVRHCHIDQTQ